MPRGLVELLGPIWDDVIEVGNGFIGLCCLVCDGIIAGICGCIADLCSKDLGIFDMPDLIFLFTPSSSSASSPPPPSLDLPLELILQPFGIAPKHLIFDNPFRIL